MKKASHILASLRKKPQFSKLARLACIERIRALFPPRLQKMIRYGYFHNGKLFFVLNHPGAKQEFDIITASIKGPLKHYMPPECADTPFDDIRAFAVHRPQQRPEASERRRSEVYYRERAHGTFDNPVEHPQLHELIERIRRHVAGKHG